MGRIIRINPPQSPERKLYFLNHNTTLKAKADFAGNEISLFSLCIRMLYLSASLDFSSSRSLISSSMRELIASADYLRICYLLSLERLYSLG